MPLEYDDKLANIYIKRLQDEIKKIKRFQASSKAKDMLMLRDAFKTWSAKEWGLDKKDVGAYVIWHKQKAMYVGEGVIAQRIRRHRDVFNNSGKSISHGKSISSSPVGRKMYEYDPNIENWEVSFCESFSKCNAEILEACLWKQLRPAFNERSALAFLKN